MKSDLQYCNLLNLWFIFFFKKLTSISSLLQVDNGRRRTIIFDPIPIEFVKKIKNKAGVSFNDVLLAAWSQAIREFCISQRCPVIKQSNACCRALMTFGFPNNETDPRLAVGNGWVPLPLDLCVGLSNIKERLDHINQKTKNLKQSPMVSQSQ